MRNRRVERLGRRHDPRRRLPFRPDLTGRSGTLEARTLLATVTVTTTVDEFDVPTNVTVSSLGTGGADGKISLREAVVAATNTGGATEIDLPVGTYNLGNVGTGELQIGNIAGQNISIKGLGTAANTIINQTVSGNRIFNYDNAQVGTIAGSLSNLTIQGTTNVNRVFGGGAILAGGPGDSLTLTNCVVQNNSTSNGTGGVGRNGGGISYSGGGNLTITNSKFLNNTAGGNTTTGSVGGAIAYNDSTNTGNLSISNTVFDNNTATGPASGGTGAAAGALFVGGAGTHMITASTFTNNSAGASNSAGGAIQAGGGTLTIADSRFFNDTAASGSGIDNTGATMNANENWWGADAFPGNPGTDTVVTTGGSTTVITRLALALSPTSSTIATNASTTLTAKIVSTSAPTVAVTGTALEGLTLTFAPGTLGSVNPATVAIANGAASTTFSSGTSSGTTSPTVTLDNGTKATSITIVGAPTANPQSATVAHDTARAITLTGSDPNSPPRSLTYIVVANPAHGTLSGTAPNLTYTPNAGYQGSDSFTFKDNNGTSDSNVATVSLTVAAATPTATSQTVSVAHNTAKGITLTGTDGNDNPALPLTFAVATTPGHGTLSGFNPATGAVTYTPAAGFHGTDTFTFTTSNGQNTSAAATVTLNVGVGTPTANAQTVSTNQNTPLGITLTGSDDDSPTLPLTFAVVNGQGPANGSISGFNPATGALTYTPNAGFHGSDSFQFTVSNGTNTSTAATVTINVSAASQATVSGTVGVSWGTSGTATLQTNADGLRLLPAGRNTDMPWLGINKLSITLSQAATLSPGDVIVSGVNVANYGPVTISGSGTNYTITLAQPINAADRVTVTIGNAGITTFTRELDVLPGDYNDDGVVSSADMVDIYAATAGAYDIFADLNGDGLVDINDVMLDRRRIGTHL